MVDALTGIQFTAGKTNIAAALEMARNELFTESAGDRDDAPNYLIIFTDGQSTVNQERTIPEAVLTRMAGAQVFNVLLQFCSLTDTVC